MNVADQIRRAAVRFSAETAALCGDERRSYAEIDERSSRLANALLGLGLAPGDRVMTLLENSIRCIEVDFALARAGLVRVSMNPATPARDIRYVLEDSGAVAFIHDAALEQVVLASLEGPDRELVRLAVHRSAPGNRDALCYETALAGADARPPRCPCGPEDLYCLFYTSGTTGRPKGVMLSHRSILQVTFNLMMEVGPRGPGEKILLMQPMSHGAGFFVLPWFLRGGACVVMPRFDPCEVLRLVREVQIETVKLVPTMLQRILACDSPVTAGDLPWLRQIIYGASPMPIEALRAGLRRFGNCFVQIYGQSEAPVTITVMHAVEHATEGADAARLASAGMAWPTVELRIVDPEGRDLPPGEVGEVLVRAPQVMAGYWNRPELTRTTLRDGWLHTRDLGRMDEQGFLFLIGRLDDMIISGGYNIAPREVEEVLYRHPAVREAAVIGEPDADWGAAVVAYVVLGSPVSVEELHSFARSEIGFKSPKRFYRLAELPKNANGKIQKIALTADVALPWKAPAE